MFEKIKPGWDWFWALINQRSTITQLGQAIGTAALLPYPYNMVCFFVCFGAAFIPDGKIVPPAA
jgi:hypothetical protein